MDYKKAAEEVLEKIGGSDNIISVAHCATRLRIVTGDNSKYSKKAVENIDGVKGVFEASGQLQIIFGTGAVNKVYDEFIALVHISGGTKEDVKAAGDIKNITAVNRSASGKAETANDTTGEQKTVTAENNSSTGDNAVKEIYSPLKGEAVKLSKVLDDTFANEILGKGMAVIPGEGLVVSPVDGEVSTLFDTLHAIGVTGDNGLELLIHVGINTVELEGKYYKALVKEGDRVTKGQPLLKFDIEGIRSAGYNTVTPVIITNSDEYESVEQVAIGDVEKSALVMNVR